MSTDGPSNVRVFINWHDQTVFAGEEVRCTITFKNVARVPGSSSSSRSRPSPQTSRHASSERLKATSPRNKTNPGPSPSGSPRPSVKPLPERPLLLRRLPLPCRVYTVVSEWVRGTAAAQWPQPQAFRLHRVDRLCHHRRGQQPEPCGFSDLGQASSETAQGPCQGIQPPDHVARASDIRSTLRFGLLSPS